MKSCSKGQRKGFRNKYLALIISMLLFFGTQAQVTPITYTPMNAAGYQMKYLKVDSGFALPYRDTSISRGTNRPGLMVINSADSLPYYYNGSYWKPVYVDSAGVIALINNKVDSVTINGNTLFYWIAGLGYGQTINKIDSVTESGDSVFTWIGGNSMYAFQLTSGSGTVTQIISGFGLVSDTITSNGTILVDTSVIAAKSWATAQFAPISHTHSASDIISGTLPIARGGTGLSGIGGVGQMLKVASSGTALQYFTPNYASQSDVHDSIVANQDTVKYQFPIYASVDTVKLRTDSMPLLTYGPSVDSSSFTDQSLINRKYLSDRIAAVTATGITRTELQDTASAIRSAFPNISGKVNISDTAAMLSPYLRNINGLVSPGTNVTVTGLGTAASPYVINSSTSGGGTVTSVAMTMPGTLFNSSVSGSPITTTGTLAPSLKNQSAYTLFGNNTSSSAAPTFFTNNFADSLKRSNDSVFRRVNGSWIFQYKDSVGSGSGGSTSGTYASMIASSPSDGKRYSVTDYLPGAWQYAAFDSTWHYLVPPVYSAYPTNAFSSTTATNSGSGSGYNYQGPDQTYSYSRYGTFVDYVTGSTSSGNARVNILSPTGYDIYYNSAVKMHFRLPVLSTSTDRYYVTLGSTYDKGTFFFEYCDSLNSGNWVCVSHYGSTYLQVNTSIAADISKPHEFTIYYVPRDLNSPISNANPWTAYFYIDKTLAGTIGSSSASIGSGSAGHFTGWGIYKTDGTGSGQLYFFDYLIYNYENDK